MEFFTIHLKKKIKTKINNVTAKMSYFYEYITAWLLLAD